MSERKVLVKYFPKNFDPKLLVKRGRGKDKLIMVRNMLPMSLRCNVCSNYLYIGTKFNMRMQICNDETYLGIKVFRFYLKCTYCYNDIIFKTDPKNHDYIVEDGGVRNYEPIKDAEQAQKLMRKMRKQEKQGNSMKALQTRTYDSKREMELMQAIDDIKNLNRRHALIDPQDLLNHMFIKEEENSKFTQDEEREIDITFDELRKKKLQQLKNQEGFQPVIDSIVQSNQGQIRETENKIKIQSGTSEKPVQSFNPKLHAIMKSNLFKPSKPESEVDMSKIIKHRVPKIKAIKKGAIPGKQNKFTQNEGDFNFLSPQ